jgi:hypothetical protein
MIPENKLLISIIAIPVILSICFTSMFIVSIIFIPLIILELMSALDVGIITAIIIYLLSALISFAPLCLYDYLNIGDEDLILKYGVIEMIIILIISTGMYEGRFF